MKRLFRLQRPGALVWLLLAAALFMRAIMPAGYMADVRGGEIVVDICNSDATWRIPLPAKETGKGHEKPAPCSFAGFAHAALDLPQALIFALPEPQAEMRASHPIRPFATAPPRLLPPARGPPLTA